MFKEIQKHISDKSKVISLRYGVGNIVGMFSMYDGLDDYLKIEYFSDVEPKFLSVKTISDVRLISSKESIENALKFMNMALNDEGICSAYCKIDEKFLNKDTLFIVKRIVEFLRREDELSEKENSFLSLTIDSLISEVEEVYNVDHESARGIVSDYLKCA